MQQRRPSSSSAHRLPSTAAQRRQQAILVCHLHRVAPTLATVFEIVALAGHIVPRGGGGGGNAGAAAVAAAAAGAAATAGKAAAGGSGSQAAAAAGAVTAAAARGARARPPRWLLAAGGAALRAAKGFAPAVVVAQAVRLAANLVREAEARRAAEIADDRAAADVRALQLGLSSVPRVDPRAPRTLDEYCAIYREWLLLLRGRLRQQSLELPPRVLVGAGGAGGDGGGDGGDGSCDDGAVERELMRFALVYRVLQARSLKEALIAMDRTLAHGAAIGG